MCGIVGYVGKRNAQDVLLDGLEKLEYRGYDSAGVALALEGGIRVVKSKGRLAELRKRLAVEALARSGCGIAPGEHRPQRHHRELWCAEGAAHGQGLYL